MEVNLKDIIEFYNQFPEEIGNLTVESRHGYYEIEWADITAYDSEIYRVVTKSGKVIEGSPDHRLFANGDWKHIRNLSIEDLLLTRDGEEQIKSIEKLTFREDLYDLQVEEVHEFYANDVVSHNSSELDALSFVLFNKPHRNINRPQLVNSINNKNCLVTVNFKIGRTKYKIVRGIKPNIFEIWKNGKLINQEASARDYQKYLETNILKLNHKSFHQVVVLGSSNFIPFMQLPAYQRRIVIEDLLDIGIFSKMNELLKIRNSNQKESIKDTENQISLVNEKIKLSAQHLSDLKQIDDRNTKKIQEEIDKIHLSIEKLQSKNEKLNHKYSDLHPKISKRIDQYQDKIDKLRDYESSIRYKIEDIVKDSKFYESNTCCPKCHQDIAEDLKDKKLSECKHKAVTLNEGYSDLKNKITELVDKLNVEYEKLKDVNSIVSQVSSNNKLINEYTSRIEDLCEQLKGDVSDNEIQKLKTNIDLLRESKNSLSELRLTQIEDKTYSEVIYELLKDTGIKTKIIKQYLPVMNKLINSYLQILDFFVSFHLDESFNETIKSRHRDDFSYASFSEGEKSRINLALLFSWRQIAKMKNSASTNLLILDEVFDGSLDSDGVENLLTILSTLDSDTRVRIISHKQDILEGKFDRKIEIEKVKNFSQIKK